jgi:hypothetical protein
MRRLSWAFGAVICASSGTFVWSCSGDNSGNDGGSDVTTSDNSAPDTGTKDSASDATGDASDGSTGPRCSTSKPFGAMTLVAELGSGDAGSSGARLSNDSLTVYYATATGGVNGNLQTATRTTANGTFGASTALLTTADAGLQGLDPSVSANGLTLYAQFNPGGFVEVRYTTRASTSANFAPLTAVSGLSGNAANHGAPFLRGDDSQLWYAARIAPDGGPTQGTNSIDIFVGAASGPGQINGIVSESEINSALDETSPAITSNGLTIFFARKQATDGGASTNFHVYSSTRGAATDPFPTPALVQELDDMPTTDTQPTWIAPDNCVIFLQSNRGGPAGAIYSATRPL